MTRAMRTKSHPTIQPMTRAISGLHVAWRLVAASWAAAEQAEQLAELSDRQLADAGLSDELARREHRVAVEGALMRRLMSLS